MIELLSIAGTALAIFVPLFIAMDPVGAVPLVISWTGDLKPSERDRQFRDALLTALAIGLIFLLGGRWILLLLGVGVQDFQVAGGAVLLVLAVTDLVSGGGHEGRGTFRYPDFGVVPIGTPLLAGPATLTTLLVLQDVFGLVPVILGLLANLLLAWQLFVRATDLTRIFGRNGLRAASKVISLLLAAIAIRLIREGVVSIIQAAVVYRGALPIP